MTTVKREAFTVQWSRLMDHAGHPYRGNEEALVLAPTGQAAIAAVLRLHPDASIHQLQRRGKQVLIIDEETA